jgi:hypothetical protein
MTAYSEWVGGSRWTVCGAFMMSTRTAVISCTWLAYKLALKYEGMRRSEGPVMHLYTSLLCNAPAFHARRKVF